MGGKLEEIEDDLRKGWEKGRLNELWALLGAVNVSIERGRGGVGGLAVVDDEGLGQIAQVDLFFILPFCLRLIDIVASFRSFWRSRQGSHTSLKFYKSVKETWRLLWGLQRLVLVVVGLMEMR